jgi:UDP-glucuronate 4-epimerase
MAITLFARAILAGAPVVVFGDGGMQRDFTHVDDIVRGILAAIEHGPAGYREYNLGSSAPVELRALVRAIAEAAGCEPIVQRGPVPLGDVDATYADITRARDELGWQPLIPLAEGLKTVIAWVREHPTSA